MQGRKVRLTTLLNGRVRNSAGEDHAKQNIRSTVQRVAYAAKETSADAALTTKVKTALSLSKRIPAGDIHVDSDGGIVTLRGEVPSAQVRELAESIARDAPGVQEARNIFMYRHRALHNKTGAWTVPEFYAQSDAKNDRKRIRNHPTDVDVTRTVAPVHRIDGELRPGGIFLRRRR